MKTVIPIYSDIVTQVKNIYEHLKLEKHEKHTGRKLSLSIIETISLSLFWKTLGSVTKKKVYDIFRPNCSYKTFVVNVNRRAFLALLVFQIIRSMNQSTAHLVKKTNSTDIPVCLNKNAKHLRGIRGQVSLAFSPDSHPKDSPLQLEASCARGEWVSLCIRDGSYIFQIGYNVGGGERTPWINNTSLFDTKTGGHIEIPVLKHCRDNLVVT